MGTTFDSKLSGAAQWIGKTANRIADKAGENLNRLAKAAGDNLQTNLKAMQEGPFELKREGNGKVTLVPNPNAMKFEPPIAGMWKGATQVARPVVQQLAPEAAEMVSKIQKWTSTVLEKGLPSPEAGKLADLAQKHGVRLEFYGDYGTQGVDAALVQQGAAELTAKIITKAKITELTEKFLKTTDPLKQDDLVNELVEIAKKAGYEPRIYVSEGTRAADDFQRVANAIADAL